MSTSMPMSDPLDPTNNESDPLDPTINPLDQFVTSIDTLRHTQISQIIPPNIGWSTRPTLRTGIHSNARDINAATTNDEREQIRILCRHGIPPILRCAAWIINVFSTDSGMTQSKADEYGTLSKVRILDHGWNLVTSSLFPDKSDLERAEVLDFGVGNDHLVNILVRDHGGEIDDVGIRSLTVLGHGVRDSLGVEFCPLMPDLCCLLLSHMPESYAFATIRQMVKDDSPYFLVVSRVQHLALCKTFSDLMRRCFPQTYTVMEQIGALTPAGLEPILKRFFVPLLRRKHVLRIMDIFTGEGTHALLRIGTTLCCLSHAHLGESIRENCQNAAVFWEGVKRYAHSKHFHFDLFLQHQAYGVQKSFRLLTRPIFPRAEFVSRIMSDNEVWARENEAIIPIHADTKTLGLVEGDVPIELAKDSEGRLNLAKWLPPVLHSTKLELIYSSNHHGRSVEMFYRKCACSKHTITMMEVLDAENEDTVIGMYATHTWRNNPDGYGDGGCFLFRLRPNAECFRYRMEEMHIQSFDDEEIHVSSSHLADAGQLMISGSDFISMGVGEDGASGLRLNYDLTRGSTSNSIGFGGKELIGKGVQVFDVGLVEVYRFVREVDGKPVDGDIDPFRGKFD